VVLFVGFQIRESYPQSFFGLSFSHTARFIPWVKHYADFGPIVVEHCFKMDSAQLAKFLARHEFKVSC